MLSFIYCPNPIVISQLKDYISEPDLIERLKAKDKLALSYLYDHYSGALYGVILRIVKNEATAEEVLQDVFFKLWNRFDHYDASKGKLFTWMVNIARNQAIDKTRSKEINKEQKTRGIEDVVSKIDNETYLEQHTDGIGVKEMLVHLPEEQRFVVEQLYFRGYSQSALAEEFNIPLGTVKTRLRLAMQQLRTTLRLK